MNLVIPWSELLSLQARERNPTRSRHTRNWNPIEAVALGG
jgi:hypothetical protein